MGRCEPLHGDDPFPFTFRYENGATMLGRARYWANDGMCNVAQPDGEVPSNVASLEKASTRPLGRPRRGPQEGHGLHVDADVLGAREQEGPCRLGLAMKGEVDNLSGTLAAAWSIAGGASRRALGGAVQGGRRPKAKSKESVSEETTARAKDSGARRAPSGGPRQQ